MKSAIWMKIFHWRIRQIPFKMMFQMKQRRTEMTKAELHERLDRMVMANENLLAEVDRLTEIVNGLAFEVPTEVLDEVMTRIERQTYFGLHGGEMVSKGERKLV